MMLRGLASIGALVLALPATAQEPEATAQSNAAQNVDCAIWASYQIAVATEPDVQQAFAIALAWYIGLYEGEKGTPIGNAMSARTAEMEDADINALTPGCLSRFSDFGNRLGSLSTLITEQEDAAE